MKIAILGATSFLVQELIREWRAANREHSLHLYSRNIFDLEDFIFELREGGLELLPKQLSCFPDKNVYDVVINCIGVGDPAKVKAMSSQILDITFQYDDMVLRYLEQHQRCKYIFLSSGAAFGGDFSLPATIDKKASFDINHCPEGEKYGLAKFITEIKHRNKSDFTIIDVRVFNFFSKNQDVSARFFITDILKAIMASKMCDIDPAPMVRDYLHPWDFCQIIDCIIGAGHLNVAVDCYSAAPIDKISLLNALDQKYGLKWRFTSDASVILATGVKCNYYSENYTLSSLGYKPKYSSLDTILTEFDTLLSQIHSCDN